MVAGSKHKKKETEGDSMLEGKCLSLLMVMKRSMGTLCWKGSAYCCGIGK